jgi:predicted CXXCH cytochrome family protein
MRPRDVSAFSVAAGIGTLTAIAFAAPEPAPKPPAALAHGPIATYDAACARCHGPNGSFYGRLLAKARPTRSFVR